MDYIVVGILFLLMIDIVVLMGLVRHKKRKEKLFSTSIHSAQKNTKKNGSQIFFYFSLAFGNIPIYLLLSLLFQWLKIESWVSFNVTLVLTLPLIILADKLIEKKFK